MVNGQKEKIGDVVINLDGDRLEFDYEGDMNNYRSNYRKEAKIIIGMPSLRRLELNGASKAYDLDKDELNPEPGKNPIGMDPSVIDFYVKGKMQMKN